MVSRQEIGREDRVFLPSGSAYTVSCQRSPLLTSFSSFIMERGLWFGLESFQLGPASSVQRFEGMMIQGASEGRREGREMVEFSEFS
jgi:hypothetical protein